MKPLDVTQLLFISPHPKPQNKYFPFHLQVICFLSLSGQLSKTFTNTLQWSHLSHVFLNLCVVLVCAHRSMHDSWSMHESPYLKSGLTSSPHEILAGPNLLVVFGDRSRLLTEEEQYFCGAGK